MYKCVFFPMTIAPIVHISVRGCGYLTFGGFVCYKQLSTLQAVGEGMINT